MSEPGTSSTGRSSVIVYFAVVFLASVVLFGLLFPCAGTLDWWQGWLFFSIMMVASVGGRLIMWIRIPELIAERSRFMRHQDAKSWDRLLAPLVAISPIVVMVVTGLDYRFDWSPPVPVPVSLAAAALLVVVEGFVIWAMSTNRFFSTEVRIQRDRGHKVVSGGPYAIVRHPAYGGLLVCLPMIALLLESMWALAAAALVAVPVVVRTALEDRALRRDLAGYAEYAAQVRYRLFPGVW